MNQVINLRTNFWGESGDKANSTTERKEKILQIIYNCLYNTSKLGNKSDNFQFKVENEYNSLRRYFFHKTNLYCDFLAHSIYYY